MGAPRRRMTSPALGNYSLVFACHEARGLFKLICRGSATPQSVLRDLQLTPQQIKVLRSDSHPVEHIVSYRRRVAVLLAAILRRHPKLKPKPFVPIARTRSSSPRKFTLTEDQLDEVRDLRARGVFWRDIAARYDVAANTLQRAAEREL